MKKFITTILAVILAFTTIVGLTACEGNGKPTTDMTNWGSIKSTGGMIAETDNYLYFINGIGVSTDDNTFGTPLKGALVAVDKSTLGNEQPTMDVVVPKLFVSSDYGAGVYLFEEGKQTYVYYATPTLEKNADGEIANSYLSFARTSLDGTKTDTFFTVEGIDTAFRIGKAGDDICILYYDKAETALKVYNTATKKAEVIVKQDAEIKDSATLDNGKKAWLSLKEYRFTTNGDEVNILFTVTAYDENYYEDKAETENYTRAEAPYNLLYSYSFGDEKDENGIVGEVLLDGSVDQVKYEFSAVEDGYLFYKETSVTGKAKTYGVELSKVDKGLTQKQKIDVEANVQSYAIYNAYDEVYYRDTTDTENMVIYKTTLIGDDSKVREQVLANVSVSTLLFAYGDDIYYYNSSSKLARCNYKDKDAEEVLISEGTVALTWYDPEIITVGDKDYIFYCDNTTAGSSYIKFVDLKSTPEEVVDEDNEENNYFTLKGQKFLGIMTEKDMANPTIAAINEIPTTEIEYKVEDGKVIFEKVREARAMYDALSKESKEAVTDAVVEKLEKAEKAEELANYYYKLNEVDEYSQMSEEKKAEFKTAYEAAKAFRQALVNEDQTRFTAIRDMVANDIKIFYQDAAKQLEKK